MINRYELWQIVQETAGPGRYIDVAAHYETKVELARITPASILALLQSMGHIEIEFADDGTILTPCEKQLNGNWRVGSGSEILELRLKP